MKNYTVIIPYFNAELTIQKLLNSIPIRDDVQVIVVNDNCPHFNKDILNRFSHVEFLTNSSRNRGAGTCRNIGIASSTGSYLIFADSDDYFTEGAFDVFDKYLTNSPDIVYFSPMSAYLSGKEGCKRHRPYKKLVQDHLMSKRDDIRYKFYVPWSKIVKKELIEEFSISFDEILASNDVNFSLKIGHYAKDIAVSTSNVYCVVESDSSLTKTFTEEVVMARFSAFCDYNTFVMKHKVPTSKVKMVFFLKLILKTNIFLFIKSFMYVCAKRFPIF